MTQPRSRLATRTKSNRSASRARKIGSPARVATRLPRRLKTRTFRNVAPEAPRKWTASIPHDSIGSRELVLVPDHSSARQGPTYLIRPEEYPPRKDEYFRDPPKPPMSTARKILIGLAIGSQLVVVIMASAAFYVVMRGTGPPTAPDFADTTPQLAATAAPQLPALTRPEPAAAIATAAPATVAPTVLAAAPAFPRPSVYGIYAISNDRLIELDQIPTAAVDPRARNTLQIVKPSRTVISDPRLTFIAYRRDLTTNAPDKVPIRIAARIAKQMTFDTTGKPVTGPPPTETWLIREQGYDLRVSPMRESSEMVLLRPDSEEFTFPPGRYELMLGGQSYDFVIAGVVTDPAPMCGGRRDRARTGPFMSAGRRKGSQTILPVSRDRAQAATVMASARPLLFLRASKSCKAPPDRHRASWNSTAGP